MNFSTLLKKLSLHTTLLLYAFAILAMFYTKEYGDTLMALKMILLSPSPLVTDYYALGNLASAFFNCALCSTFCTILINLKQSKLKPSVYAGYFLVIAHCFYGLNLVNMLPCALASLAIIKLDKRKIRDNLSAVFFTTAFGPFAGELIFRYPFPNPVIRIIVTFIFAVFMAYMVPLALKETKKWHQGYNLYNGGLALGLWGMMFYAFFFKTMDISPTPALNIENPVYESFGRSYALFVNVFFFIFFLTAILIGHKYNSNSFVDYDVLLREDSYKSDYSKIGNPSLILINMGVYGLLILAYMNIVIFLCDGVGFTGATTGAIIASLTFTASGQQPRNALPILCGYVCLYLLVYLCKGGNISWSLSSQGYINGVAFATGLCPISGVYGPLCGIFAGMLDGILCTSTSAMHGGLMLYNGGLTAGLTALLVLPLFEYLRIKKITKEPTD